VDFASVYECVVVTTSAARQTHGGPDNTGTDSWLDDTGNKFGLDLLYCLKCTKSGQLAIVTVFTRIAAHILSVVIKSSSLSCCRRSYFLNPKKDTFHQNESCRDSRFRLNV